MFKLTLKKQKNNIILSDGSFLFIKDTTIIQKKKNKIIEKDLKHNQKILYGKINSNLNENLNIKNLNYRRKLFK